MHMIGHQTVPIDAHPVALPVFGKSLKISLVVAVSEKGLLSLIPAHDYVVKQARSKDPRAASHANPCSTLNPGLSRMKGLTPISPDERSDPNIPGRGFQLFYVYFGKDAKPPVRHKAAVADKTMEMRVKVDEISESLDRDHSPWHGFFFIQCLTEELLKRLKGALAELPQKLPIESKIGPDSGHVSFGNAAIF